MSKRACLSILLIAVFLATFLSPVTAGESSPNAFAETKSALYRVEADSRRFS